MTRYTLTFSKEGSRDIIYIHDEDNNTYFQIPGAAPEGRDRIVVTDANVMNTLMNILSDAGYDAPDA